MIQFNFNRFGKLVRWSLTNDKRYYVKSFLQIFVVLLLIFLFFTLMVDKNDNYRSGYQLCCVTVCFMLAVTMVMGSSFMFYSMEGKHDKQALMLLPASNFEKYLMRYATWIILLPLYLVAFLVADLLQYVVHWMLGYEGGTFVVSVIAKLVSTARDGWNTAPLKAQYMLVNSALIVVLWFHSFYALGATFFRSRKFNWVLTTIVAILLTMFLAWPFPYEEHITYEGTTLSDLLIVDIVTACWVMLNFWLSYKLFCRTQVIGKYVNI